MEIIAGLPIREKESKIPSPHGRGPSAVASQSQFQKLIHVSVIAAAAIVALGHATR